MPGVVGGSYRRKCFIFFWRWLSQRLIVFMYKLHWALSGSCSQPDCHINLWDLNLSPQTGMSTLQPLTLPQPPHDIPSSGYLLSCSLSNYFVNKMINSSVFIYISFTLLPSLYHLSAVTLVSFRHKWVNRVSVSLLQQLNLKNKN